MPEYQMGEIYPEGKYVGSYQIGEGEPTPQFEPIRERPPANGITKRFKDRQRWERLMVQKYGDPWEKEKKIPYNAKVEALKTDETLFSHIFGNQYRYEDRYKLDKKAQSYWNDIRMKNRKRIEDIMYKKVGEEIKLHQKRVESFDKFYGKAKPSEPLVRVMEEGKEVWRPRSEAAGEEAGRVVSPFGEFMRGEEPGVESPEQIRENWKQGKITRDEALEALRKLGYK